MRTTRPRSLVFLPLLTLVTSGVVVVASSPGVPVATAQSAVTADAPAPSELETARAEAKQSGKRVELPTKRTATSTTFVEPSGELSTDYASAPIRVKQDGSWMKVDRTLEPRSGAWRPKAAAADVALSSGGSATPLAKASDDDRSLAMSWPGALPAPAVDGSVATYQLSGGRSLKVTATSTGFRVNLVLTEQPTSPLVVRLPLDLTGLSISERSDGSFAVTDTTGKTVFDLAMPLMWDSVKSDAGDPANVVRVPARLVSDGGKKALELTPDMTFLSRASYPVTVDPAISSVTFIRDAYVSSSAPTTSHGAQSTLRTGLETSTSKKRAFTQFETPALQGKTILDAQLKLYNAHSGSCTPKRVYLWPITESWTSATTWNTQPASLSSTSSYSTYKDFSHGNEALGCSNAFESIAVTAMVRGWVNGSLANHGVALRTNEADTANFKVFCSAEEDPSAPCYSPSFNPVLSVTYTSTPNAVDKRSMTPGDSADVGTVTPTLHGKFSDPDIGETGTVSYEVYSGASGPLVASGSGLSVAIGADSKWTVPTGKLTANTTYRWRTRGVDMHGVAGPWSETKFFNTQNASLIGDQRRFTFEERDLTDRSQLRANVANGNLLLQSKDLHIRGTGIDFTLDRYYNSRSTSVSALGKGWVLGVGHDVKLIPSASSPGTNDVTYVAPSGFTARFANSGTDTWRHPPGVGADLSRNAADGTWTLAFHKTEGKFEFNSSGRFEREKDRNGNTISFTYNTSGLLSKVTDTQTRDTTLTYVNGRLDKVTDPTGRTTTYTYTADGNLETVTDAAGKVTRYRYNGDLVDQITYGDNSITRLDYDGSRRLVDHFTSFDPGNGVPTNATTSFQYLSGETKVTDPNGNNTSTSGDGITTYRYDDRDRVTKVIDQLGHEQGSSYTSTDNVSTLTDALQKQVTLGWDPNDENLTSVSLPTGAKSEFTYNSSGPHPHSVIESTDAQKHKSTYTYDTPGNLDTIRSDEYPDVLEDRDYNANGTVKQIKDGNGTITSFDYDTNGNLKFVNNPAPLGDVTLTPDSLSRLKTMMDGKNQTTTYTYDPIDRQDVVTFHGGATVDQDFDAAGNLTKVTDPTGITTFIYDKLNRQTRKTLPNSQQLRYEYDHIGNLTEYGDAGGDVIYTYDEANRLQTLLEPGASTPVDFDYDDDNRRTKITYPTSPVTVQDITYDDSGRQKSIKATSNGSTLSTFSYDYTKVGADTALRQSVTDSTGTTTYGYDKLNRLTTASGALSRTYEYNIDFNRTKKIINGTATTYDYNAANELTSVNGAQTYNYDGNGNLTSGGGWSFTHNTANQTTSITKPSGTALSPMTYAGQDQTERRSAGDTIFVTSALGVSSATSPAGTDTLSTASVGEEETKPPKGETHYYTRDNAGNLVSVRTPSGRFYYLFDGLGSVVGLVDNTGSKVNNYRYDPYGEQITATQTVANPWRYTAGHHDGQTGLTKLGTRYYNPTEARFTQPDPSGKDLRYTYAGCDPINHTDPTGQWYCDLGGTLGFIGGFTGGITYGDTGWHPYLGGGLVSPPGGISFTCSGDQFSHGDTFALQAAWGLAVQAGIGGGGYGGGFTEIGIGTPGISVLYYYGF